MNASRAGLLLSTGLEKKRIGRGGHRKAMLAAGFINGPVCCDKEGDYLRFSNLYRDSYHPIVKWAGLPELRLYDLCHTCATLLLLADVPAKVISERVGHSSITLTLDTYSRVLPAMQQRAAEIMGRLLGRKPAAVANGGTLAVPGENAASGGSACLGDRYMRRRSSAGRATDF
jgi:hypothetical protein